MRQQSSPTSHLFSRLDITDDEGERKTVVVFGFDYSVTRCAEVLEAVFSGRGFRVERTDMELPVAPAAGGFHHAEVTLDDLPF